MSVFGLYFFLFSRFFKNAWQQKRNFFSMQRLLFFNILPISYNSIMKA